MLAALLGNIPVVSQYGTPAPVRSSSSWNPKWSEQYGPDARRLATERKSVERAVSDLKNADYVPTAIIEAKDIVHSRSLVDELTARQSDTDETLVYVLEAWLFFIEWRNRDDEAIATTILMMD